jgi:hypothetical protein
MQLLIGTPYRANAIVNIARAAVVHKQLQRIYTTLYLARLEAGVKLGRRVSLAVAVMSFPWCNNKQK